MTPGLNLNRWREEVGRSVLNLDFRAASDEPFHYALKPLLLHADLKMALNSHAPGFTFRDRDLVKDGCESIGMAIAVGCGLNFCERRQGMLRAGDATMLRTDIPASLGSAGPCKFLSIVVRPDVFSRDVDLEQLAGYRWPRELPGVKLLKSYIDTLKGMTLAPGTDLADVVRRHVLDLVNLAARELTRSDTRDLLAHSTIGEARLRIALEDIRQCFRDPGLTESMIAARQGISTRYLQRIFEESGLTFSQHVQALRLEAAYDALSKPATAYCSVIEIAFGAGFTDISNFNRLFRRRFGMTPTMARGSRR